MDDSFLGGVPDSFEDLKVETVVETEKSASLQITFDGQSQMLYMVKVENRWVPKDLAGNWKEFLSGTKQKIDSLTAETLVKQKPQILMMMAAVKTGLEQLRMTKTQVEFDRTLQLLLMDGISK